MSSRKVLRRLRSKTALLVLVAVAAVGLTVPTLAGALDQPNDHKPERRALSNAAWDQTIAFSTASNPDLSATSYTLFRKAGGAGACSVGGGSAADPEDGTVTSLDGIRNAHGREVLLLGRGLRRRQPGRFHPVKITYDTRRRR